MRTRPIAPGTVVWIRQQPWRTERTIRERGVVRFDVARGEDRATFLAPFDRPIAGRRPPRPVRVRGQQGLARIAGALAATNGVRTLIAARDARIDLLPYQLEPALAILDGHRRVLVADEVGLGKTVQAGVVVAELMRRSPACRVLVIAPAGLRDQWADELTTRFSLATRCTGEASFEAADRDGLPGTNGWRQPGVWLTSSDWIKQVHVLGGIPLTAWDLVVIDEAHTVVGRTERHEACAELVRRARHALFLSATPHSGDEARFARLLALGALSPNEPLLTFRRTRASVGLARRRNVRWIQLRPLPGAADLLDELAAFEQSVLRRGRRAHRDAALLLLAVFRRRALSSFAALERSLTKRLAWLARDERGRVMTDALQGSLNFGDDDDDLTDEERGALWGDAGLRAADERRLLERLCGLTRIARASDPKLTRLRRLTVRTADPIVIFTEFRDSLEAVREAIEPIRPTAVLHGGQTCGERSDELARFLRGEATALIATDVAGQGLNLQGRARWIVNLELPWNPSRIEQRIGRVDRIGQSRVVHVSILVTHHPTEAPLIQSLARRVMAANRALGETRDTLGAAPSPRALAASVFDGQPLVRTEPRVLPAQSRAWTLTARANVRVLARRRAWRRHWRGALDARGRPVAWSSRTASSRTAPFGLIVGFAVPLVDATGLEVERHVVALTLQTPQQSRAWTSLQAGRIAGSQLVPRVRRATAWIAATSARAVANETAIARHLLSVCRPGATQAALFDRRQLVRQQRAVAAAEGVDRDRAGRLAREANRLSLRTGSPELLWVWRRS